MKSGLIKYFPYFLFIYHLVFAWLAYDYVNQNNGDAVRYWFVGQNTDRIFWSDFLSPGTDAVKLITYPLVHYLQMPPLWGCLLFSAISGYGFIRLWKLIKSETADSLLLIGSALLLVLPNAHFWTSVIGKEALLFLPMVLIAEKLYKGKYFSVISFISFFLIAWIRPHLAFVLLAAYMIALLWKGEISRNARVGLIIAGLISVAGLYFLLEKITNARGGLFQKIERLYGVHNLKLRETSAYVPLEDYVYPYKLFSFYFRPLPWEKEGLYYQVVGLENLIHIVLFLGVIYLFIRWYKNIKLKAYGVFAFLFLIFYASMLVYGYANFGMIIRSKALALPAVFLLLVFIIGERKPKSDFDS